MRRVYPLNRPIVLTSWASVTGPKEHNGPLGDLFDLYFDDDALGEKTWEKGEVGMYEAAVRMAIDKIGLSGDDINFMSGGDLLNQIISSNYSARALGIPFLGLYGACSTFAESLMINSMLLSGGYGERAVSVTSSHFSTAERQYRFPLEYGNQRPETSQWTVTGAGAVVLATEGEGPKITMVTPGKVVDYGIVDAANMGAAMAPAAAETILAHFKESGFTPEDYDLIITGDLGVLGSQLLVELLEKNGLDAAGKIHTDCGCEIFAGDKHVNCGGSGCGCSAVVMTAKYLRALKEGSMRRILHAATGALLSPTSTLQGESIPGIAHAVTLEA